MKNPNFKFSGEENNIVSLVKFIILPLIGFHTLIYVSILYDMLQGATLLKNGVILLCD